MNRLTKKDKDHIGGYAPNGTYDIDWKANAFERLGQYEDADEKLEIDFPTYVKYIDSKKAFVKEDSGDIEECYVIGGTLDSIILMPVAFPYGECEFTRKFKEYGTKWALERKELENETSIR